MGDIYIYTYITYHNPPPFGFIKPQLNIGLDSLYLPEAVPTYDADKLLRAVQVHAKSVNEDSYLGIKIRPPKQLIDFWCFFWCFFGVEMIKTPKLGSVILFVFFNGLMDCTMVNH